MRDVATISHVAATTWPARSRFTALALGTCGFFALWAASLESVWLTHSTAELSRTTLEWFGLHVTRNGMQLQHASGFHCSVGIECTIGLPLAAFWLALALAPGTSKTRWRGALLGLIILVVANTVRVNHLVWLGVHLPAQFDLWHRGVWRMLMIGVPLLLFAWVTRCAQTRTGD